MAGGAIWSRFFGQSRSPQSSYPLLSGALGTMCVCLFVIMLQYTFLIIVNWPLRRLSTWLSAGRLLGWMDALYALDVPV